MSSGWSPHERRLLTPNESLTKNDNDGFCSFLFRLTVCRDHQSPLLFSKHFSIPVQKLQLSKQKVQFSGQIYSNQVTTYVMRFLYTNLEETNSCYIDIRDASAELPLLLQTKAKNHKPLGICKKLLLGLKKLYIGITLVISDNRISSSFI